MRNHVLSDRPADAVLVPEYLKHGRRSYHRMCSILAIAEPLLGCRDHEKGYIRKTLFSVQKPDNPQERGCLLFITKCQHDTLNYPTGHPKHPKPRYRWEQDGEIQLGYLLDPPEDQIGIYDRIPAPSGDGAQEAELSRRLLDQAWRRPGVGVPKADPPVLPGQGRRWVARPGRGSYP